MIGERAKCCSSFLGPSPRVVNLVATMPFAIYAFCNLCLSQSMPIAIYLSKAGSASAISSGVVLGSNRSMTSPCFETRNLVKFQPMSPGLAVFSQSYSGLALGPLTSILANMGNVAWYRFVANSRISALLPGS